MDHLSITEEQIDVFEQVQTALQNEMSSVKIQNHLILDSVDSFYKLYKKVLYSLSFNSLQILKIFHGKNNKPCNDLHQNFDPLWDPIKCNPFDDDFLDLKDNLPSNIETILDIGKKINHMKFPISPDFLFLFKFHILPNYLNFFQYDLHISTKFIPFLQEIIPGSESDQNYKDKKKFFFECCSTIFYSHPFRLFCSQYIRPFLYNFLFPPELSYDIPKNIQSGKKSTEEILNFLINIFSEHASDIPFYISYVLNIIPQSDQAIFIRDYFLVPLFNDPAFFGLLYYYQLGFSLYYEPTPEYNSSSFQDLDVTPLIQAFQNAKGITGIISCQDESIKSACEIHILCKELYDAFILSFSNDEKFSSFSLASNFKISFFSAVERNQPTLERKKSVLNDTMTSSNIDLTSSIDEHDLLALREFLKYSPPISFVKALYGKDGYTDLTLWHFFIDIISLADTETACYLEKQVKSLNSYELILDMCKNDYVEEEELNEAQLNKSLIFTVSKIPKSDSDNQSTNKSQLEGALLYVHRQKRMKNIELKRYYDTLKKHQILYAFQNSDTFNWILFQYLSKFPSIFDINKIRAKYNIQNDPESLWNRNNPALKDNDLYYEFVVNKQMVPLIKTNKMLLNCLTSFHELTTKYDKAPVIQITLHLVFSIFRINFSDFINYRPESRIIEPLTIRTMVNESYNQEEIDKLKSCLKIPDFDKNFEEAFRPFYEKLIDIMRIQGDPLFKLLLLVQLVQDIYSFYCATYDETNVHSSLLEDIFLPLMKLFFLIFTPPLYTSNLLFIWEFISFIKCELNLSQGISCFNNLVNEVLTRLVQRKYYRSFLFNYTKNLFQANFYIITEDVPQFISHLLTQIESIDPYNTYISSPNIHHKLTQKFMVKKSFDIQFFYTEFLFNVSFINLPINDIKSINSHDAKPYVRIVTYSNNPQVVNLLKKGKYKYIVVSKDNPSSYMNIITDLKIHDFTNYSKNSK